MSLTRAPLALAVDRAIAGDRAKLFDLLTRGSGLPGTRVNLTLALQLASECASRGATADALIVALATLDPDFAPGGGGGPHGAGGELEFLPVCGVLAAGVRASSDERARPRMLEVLHDAAEDLRFRVREAVPLALEEIAKRAGDELTPLVASWMDGYFHAAAVLRGLVRHEWLVRIKDPSAAIARFEEAFELASSAPRAAARYPGFKALLEALRDAVEPMASRFGVPMFDAMVPFSKSKDPVLRELIVSAVSTPKLRSRHREDVERVLLAFAGTRKPVRDPRSLPRPTRKRGGGRRRSGPT